MASLRPAGAPEAGGGNAKPLLHLAGVDHEAESRQLLTLAGSHPIVRCFPQGALIVFDHDLRYLCAGGLGLDDVGLSRAMLEGRTVSEVFPPETR